MEQTAEINEEEPREPQVVDASNARVWSDDTGVVHISINGRELRDVRPVKVFPLSKKCDYVSFLGEKGTEVALIGNLRSLDKESRKVLDHALERMYYVARITQVIDITEVMGISRWQVMTDRGFASFEVVARDHIRSLPDGKYVIIDADGSRFEIPSISQLDRRSQSLVFSET